jgi:hypothetical protein
MVQLNTKLIELLAEWQNNELVRKGKEFYSLSEILEKAYNAGAQSRDEEVAYLKANTARKEHPMSGVLKAISGDRYKS